MQVFKETPLSEITFRKYEKPGDLKPREVVRKFCLSVGLLQPGDSRDVIIDILYVLLKSRKKKNLMNIEEIEEKVIKNRKLHNVELKGIASSNIRRQIRRMKELLLIEKRGTSYRIAEFDSVQNIFVDKIENVLLKQTIDRAKEYCSKLDEFF